MSSLVKCQLTVKAVQKDRTSPCPFAQIAVFKAVPFLWWELWSHVLTLTANFYGTATFTLDKDQKYFVRTRWTGADGRTREWSEPIKLTICPYTMTVTAPW